MRAFDVYRGERFIARVFRPFGVTAAECARELVEQDGFVGGTEDARLWVQIAEGDGPPA